MFASYKVDLGKELKKQVGVEKDENYVIINDCEKNNTKINKKIVRFVFGFEERTNPN